MNKILVVCLNPTIQITLKYNKLLIGEVNRTSVYYQDASGKGVNVARVLTQLNTAATLLTHVGGARQDEFLALAKGVNIIHCDSSSPIRTCISILEDGKTTELVQEPLAVESSTEERINELYEKILPEFSAVIFTGTKSPGYSKGLYPKWVKRAKEEGKIVLLDIKGDELLNCLEYKPDYIKTNLVEFVQTFNKDITLLENAENLEVKDTVLKISRKLYESGINTIITRGSYDTWYYDGYKIASSLVEKVKAVNTIGCGDAFSSGFISSIINGKSFQESLEKANEVAKMNALSIKPGNIVLSE